MYFFVAYIVAKGDLEIEHCPVGSIWANILTKNLQCRAFREFRAELMKFPVDYKEENVGINLNN